MEPSNHILFFNYHENIDINEPIAKELVANRLQFTKHTKHYLIQQFGNIRDINYEAIEYFKDPESGAKNLLGVAYIAPNNSSRQFAENFINYPKKFPAKIFNTENEAIEWINELKDYHKVIQQ
jgi:hypothetical protein